MSLTAPDFGRSQTFHIWCQNLNIWNFAVRTIFDFDPVLHGGNAQEVRPPIRWKETEGAFLAMANLQEDVPHPLQETGLNGDAM